MARGKKHTPVQIVHVLRQIEVAIANGKLRVRLRELAEDRRRWGYRRLHVLLSGRVGRGTASGWTGSKPYLP